MTTKDDQKRNKMIDSIIEKDRTQLDLNWKKINDANMQHVATKQLDDVRLMNLIGNYLTCNAFVHLKDANFKSLQQLFISQKQHIVDYNNIGPKGCKLLARIKWPLLRTLTLDSCSIQNEGIFHLSKTQWKVLQSLNLNDNLISLTNLKDITKIDAPLLNAIQLSYNPIPIEFSIILTGLVSQMNTIKLGYFEEEDSPAKIYTMYLLNKRFPQIKPLP